MRFLRRLPVPLVLVGLVAIAALNLGRIYAGPLVIRLVVGAAAGAVAVSLASRRLPSWLVAPVSVLGLTGYTLLAVWLAAERTQTAGPLPELIADALRNGIPRLLTAMIPVEPTPDTVLVPVVTAWLVGLAGAELAVRAGRVLLGFAPAVALYAGAVYVVGPNAPAAAWPAVGFAALIAVGLALTGRPAPPELVDLPAGARAAFRARAVAGVAGAVATVLAVTAVAGPWIAAQVGAAPVDPRRYVQPPQVDSLDESPLVRISGWALNPDQHLFDVRSAVTGAGAPGGDAAGNAPASPGRTGTEPAVGNPGGADARTGTEPTAGGGAGTRLRLAVLPDYDGVTWRVGATYRSAGRVLPEPLTAPGARIDVVHQRITVADLTGRLLPAVPTPRTVDGARVAYDPGTGTLIRPEGLSAGLAYTLTSVLERPDLNLLPTADVPAGEPVARFLRVGSAVPEQLQRLADQLAQDNGAPHERAAAVEQFLSEHYRLVADAPSGHAYPNLLFFLFGPRGGGGQQGTSEQFAASFAVLGRLMGLPTRVVVGFQAPPGGGAVRGADAYAWPEVLFDELGWVSFDPLPRPDTPPRPVEEDFKPVPDRKQPSPPEPSAAPAPTPDAGGTAVAAPPDRGAGPAVLIGGGSAGLVTLLGAGCAAVVLLRRAQRRRRLGAGDPAGRVIGAWLEVTDALRLAGRPVPGHLAATEVVAHAVAVAERAGSASPDDGRVATPGGAVASERTSVPSLDELAALLNTSAFAPAGPGGGGPVQPDDERVRRAGRQAVAYAADLRARRPWWRRVWWSVHPGPLRWHRRR